MMRLREKEEEEEEGDTTNASTIAASTSLREWSSAGINNPRIVRVSRTFGGKDRHSKVQTIKGLRDRRIRVSVPTAIQLYDLQDRLGSSQPSKVIDWLLDIAKHDIDELPPLPVMPGIFAPFQQDMNTSQQLSSPTTFIDSNFVPSRREGIKINSQRVDVNEEQSSFVEKLNQCDSNAIMRSKLKSSVLAQVNLFPIASGDTTSVLPPTTCLSNHPMHNYYHWEPSNLSLTQLESLGLSSQNAHHHHQQQGHSSNSSSIPSPLLALSSGSQLNTSPSMTSTSSYIFPQHGSYVSDNHHQVENDIRQLNHFQLSNNSFTSIPQYTSSSALGLKPFPLSMSRHHLRQHKNEDGQWKETSRN